MNPRKAIEVIDNEVWDYNKGSPWAEREERAPDRFKTDPGQIPPEKGESGQEQEQFPECAHES